MTPFSPRELPAPRGLAQLGPGVILFALSQGSGELIWWPYLVSRYGLAFLGLLAVASFIQWPVTQAIGRYTATTGETFVAGLLRTSRLFSAVFWLMFTLSFLWFGAYVTAGGTALAELTGFPPEASERGRSMFWAGITLAVFVVSIFVSRGAYSLIKRTMLLVAVVTFVLLLWTTLGNPEVLATAASFWPALVPAIRAPQRPFDPADAKVLVTALLFAGLGGFWNIFYSNWVLRAGYGMAAAGRTQDDAAARGRKWLLWRKLIDTDSKVEFPSGSVPLDTPEGPQRLRGWLRLLNFDTGIGVVGNFFTTILLCWLAWVYLTPTGTVPNGWKLASVQAAFFENVIPYGRYVFLTVAALFLADTWLTTVDAVARVHTEFSLAFFPRLASVPPKALYYVFIFLLTGVTIVTMLIQTPAVLLLLTGVLNAAAMIFLCGAVYVLNYHFMTRHVPKWAAPGRLSAGALIVIGLAYAGLFVWYMVVS